ncbi:MAG: flagellar motor protein MotB [Desulfotalea sp.]
MACDECSNKKEKKCAAGAPAWMVTYSDLVTLLLTFFVLLLSMANMDPQKIVSASTSLKAAIGLAPPAPVDYTVPVFPSMPITKFTPFQKANTTKVHDKIKNQIKALRINNDVEIINTDGDTIILRIQDSVLFARNQTHVSPSAYMLLRTIADIIRPLPVLIKIEGHGDDVQGVEEIANWDVSTARAVSVMRFFHRSNLLSLERLSAVGFADDKPIAPNNSPENKAKNRRVDFTLRLKPPEKKAEDNSLIPL